jgi:hypothetical protein
MRIENVIGIWLSISKHEMECHNRGTGHLQRLIWTTQLIVFHLHSHEQKPDRVEKISGISITFAALLNST